MFGGKSGALPTTMKHDFSKVPKADIPRSSFDRSHGIKTAFDSGYLVPIYVDEALPGDTFNLSLSSFARLSTPIKPSMDNLWLDTFFFAVPVRLLWANFQKFMGAQANPGDSTSYLVPTVTIPASGAAIGSLSDYFGLPTVGQVAGANTVVVDSLWHRAYNLIWNEWFRDQNLQNSVVITTGDGPDTYTDYTLLKRGKRHDYFTACLPWPQKGTAVTMPLGSLAPVKGIGLTSAGRTSYSDTPTTMYESGGTNRSYSHFQQASSGTVMGFEMTAATSGYPTVYADLSAATAATINSLRQAFQIQKLYERDARGGTRYTEVVRAHFGVTSPDARLQRPEYLGGGSSAITQTPIPQTAPAAGGSTPIGNLSAIGHHSQSGQGFTKGFTEHMVLIGLANVRADLNYQQGLARMFSRQTRWDFYWPALSHIGEQAVLNQELYCDGSANDAATFGYQERYAEYRYKPSVITGLFRSTAATTLDVWHYAQKFTSLPTLGDTFIKETPPLARNQAVTSEPQILFDGYINLKCARPMPVYSVPGLIDHF